MATTGINYEKTKINRALKDFSMQQHLLKLSDIQLLYFYLIFHQTALYFIKKCFTVMNFTLPQIF